MHAQVRRMRGVPGVHLFEFLCLSVGEDCPHLSMRLLFHRPHARESLLDHRLHAASLLLENGFCFLLLLGSEIQLAQALDLPNGGRVHSHPLGPQPGERARSGDCAA